MTKQEIFDKVATHLLTQNAKSIVGSGVDSFCRYRGENGMKCAVGVLISDDEYRECFEGHSASSVVRRSRRHPDLRRLVDHMDFLDAIQSIHDYADVGDWPESLKQLAVEHALNSDVVVKMTEARRAGGGGDK
jgi:hypothetical protein